MCSAFQIVEIAPVLRWIERGSPVLSAVWAQRPPFGSENFSLMSDAKPQPSFVRLEKAALTRDFPTAVAELLAILDALQSGRGSFNGFDMGARFTEGGDRELYRHLSTRYAAAFGDILTAPDTKISAADVERLFIFHRWTDMIFRVSGFQTSDHLLARLPHNAEGMLALNNSSVVNFLLAYSPSSTGRDQSRRLLSP